ncbi:relaxin-3 [Sorex fumeus]|uniref:relaxin-3 n=1 Tax=Sorex fumeus TaxID=62283 RepID=UPI0024AE727A|nr:relaxin-3 [Sorex fumeus]
MAQCPLLLPLLLLPPLLAADSPAADPAWAVPPRAAPARLKLCGREFVRAVIFSCGGSRWRRAGQGNAFPDSNFNADDSLDVASSEWLSFTLAKDPQDPYRGQRGWQGAPGVPRVTRDIPTGLSSYCCKLGCSKTEISRLC